MGARSLLLAAALVLPGSVCLSAGALPEETQGQVEPKVENSKYQFEAVVNASSVQVRSGPSENYYATGKLEKGSHVKVVGIKFDWLKIVPPDGSFSVVAKRLVDKAADGNSGVINAENVNIRAGSALNNVKVTVQCKLNKGDKVEILGEDGDYYKIAPPAEAYLYVNQKFADPVKQLAANGADEKPVKVKIENGAEKTFAQGPTTKPAEPKVAVTVHEKIDREAAEQLKAQEEFERLEGLSKVTWDKGLDEMPVEDLLAGYQALLKNDYLPGSQRAMAEVRVLALNVKAKAKGELAEARKRQAEADQKLEKLRQERAEIENRLKTGQRVYTAVGTLQPTAVKSGETPTYRLTDPTTERTLCYVKSDDAKYVDLVGKFIGVRGELTVDGTLTLKTIKPTEVEEIDPAQVNKTVSAQIVPPSLVSGKSGETASSGPAAGDER